MKIVLAFEGIDGSGKSSLVAFTQKLCDRHGQRFTLIGRREAHSNTLIARLTRLLHEESPNLHPHGENLIRLAREYHRACLAALAPSGVVVLDRFAITIITLARFHGHAVEAIESLLKDIVARAHLHSTVLVQCPFDVARNRVLDRRTGAVLRPTPDDRLLCRLAELMQDEFDKGILTGQRWPVDNSMEVEVAEEQLAGYLMPYFQLASNSQRAPSPPALGLVRPDSKDTLPAPKSFNETFLSRAAVDEKPR
jgi:thymidylate kinase